MTEKKEKNEKDQKVETKEKGEKEVKVETGEQAEAAAEGNEELATEEVQLLEAEKISRKHVYWAAGVGLFPMPVLDLCALSAIQLKMLHSLSKHYEVDFKENMVKSIIATLSGTLGSHALRRSGITHFLRAIPVIGIVGAFSMSIYNGALTYAIGKVFIQHFESGGTFLDFEPVKTKEYFKKFFEEGKQKVSNLKTKKA